MHCDLDALDDFLEEKHPTIEVPLEDMTAILTQLWKSRQTEPIIGQLYEKYKALIPEE